MNLLDKISSLLGAGHKEAVKSILNTLRKRGEISTPRDIETEAKRLVSKTSAAASKQVFTPVLVVPESKISSTDHNTNMENSYIDLKGLYKQTDSLSNLQGKQKDALVDEFSKARAAILKLINDARVFALRNRKPEYDDIKLINFNIARNSSKVSPIATIDADSRLLKLPTIMKRRAHLPNRSSRTTTITVDTIGGQLGQLGKQFPPDQAVDSKPESFWAEIVYSDINIQNEYNRWGPNAEGTLTDIVNGPISKITLSFSSAEAINQVRVLPFSVFPVRVVEITYRPTSSSRIRYPIKDFVSEESLDWIEYNFETVFATDIEIILSQENYRSLIIHVPKSILYATDFLLRLQEQRTKEIGELPNLRDVNLGGNFDLYSSALEDLSTLMDNKELEKTPITEIDLAGKTILSIGEALSVFNPDLQSLLEEVSSYTDSLPTVATQQIETINKLEYVIGAREIETNYVVYSPLGHYESERFEPASTIANVELEVEERHPQFRSQYGNYTRTSTEWEIELAEDRRIPIYPSNFESDGYLKVVGELLDVNQYTAYGYSRFKSFLSYVLVRENDVILTANTDYTVVWNTDYNGKLQIQINPTLFDANKIYTIDYYADPSAKSIDVLTMFRDKALATPDVFDGTLSNNDVKLSTFPYINYNIINSSSFVYSDTYNAYQYQPPTGAYATGRIHLQPEWIREDGSLVTGISGSVSGSGLTGYNIHWETITGIYFQDPYRYYLKLTDVPGATFEVASVVNSGVLTLTSAPRLYTGLVGSAISNQYFSGNFTGTPPSGFIEIPYSLEVVYRAGEQTFGFDNLIYDPIQITVGGTKAKNITSYQNLEQPAFNVADAADGEYEFIHDGRTIFFNQAITNTEIQASYRWMTQYVKVNCTLRSNKIVSPTVTPQVNQYSLLLNTTIL